MSGGEGQGDIVDELLSSVLGGESTAEAEIAKEQALVRVRVERRKRHLVTVIEFDSSDVKALDIDGIARSLSAGLRLVVLLGRTRLRSRVTRGRGLRSCSLRWGV